MSDLNGELPKRMPMAPPVAPLEGAQMPEGNPIAAWDPAEATPRADTADRMFQRQGEFGASAAPSAEVASENRGFRERIGKKAGAVIVAAALIAGGAFAYKSFEGHNGGDSKNGTASATTLSGAEGAQSSTVCPDGIFPHGPFESNKDISTTGDLHTRPTETLDTKSEYVNYFFGKDGVACDSAVTLAVVKAGVVDMLGDGAAKARGFDTPKFDEQVAIYLKNHKTALNDAKDLEKIISDLSVTNPKKLEGAYQQVIGVDIDGKISAAFQEKQVSFDKNTVWILPGTSVRGDNVSGGDHNQIMVVDKESGQIFFLNSIGLDKLKPQDKPTSAKNNQGKSGGSSAPSGGKARGDVKEQNSGPADNNDNVGNTPEADNNGTDQTPGGGGGGTHETGTTTPGTVPETTTPYTVPNTTQPTQTTIPHPTTTIKPKSTNPGCPPGAPEAVCGQ